MQITETRIRIIDGCERLRGIASITLDDSLILNDIRIIKTRTRLCVEFPRYIYLNRKGLEEYIIVPKSMKVRKYVEAVIITAYTERLKNRAVR